MKHVICPSCGNICIKHGKTTAGSQRWRCKKCLMTVTQKIDNTSKQLQIFFRWLFGKQSQKEMIGDGRTFRRKTVRFWDIGPMPPKIEASREVVYVDGIYMGRKACVLICCDDKNVLGWYLCRYEHSGAYKALISRIAEPIVVVSDGGTGFAKALKKVWPNSRHQRYISCVQSGETIYDKQTQNTSRIRVIYTSKRSVVSGKTRGNAAVDIQIY